jgi:hypothetical protein
VNTMTADETRWQQEFYSQAEPIRLKDPLASFLGAIAPDGIMVYRFEDAVKLAGHSCPAVATAYKMTARALARLYPNETPVRGEINVVVPGAPGDGALGPMSQVIAFITGAAPESGFKGLAGHFRRFERLKFNGKDNGAFVFQRSDTGKTVEITPHTDRLPQNDRMRVLMPKLLSGKGDASEREEFTRLWQANVRRVLGDEIPGLFEITEMAG